MLVSQSGWIDSIWSAGIGRQGQLTRIDGQICLLFGRPRSIGWNAGQSANLDGENGLLISQSTRIDRLVCWSHSQPR